MDQRCPAGDHNVLEDGDDGEKEVETRDTAVLHGVVVDSQAVLVVLLDRRSFVGTESEVEEDT